LKKVGLEDWALHLPNQMSGGQKQRVAIARALVGQPKVILADEPTGNLDARNADKLMKELVNTVKQESKTAIVVTHDISMAIKYGDQVVLLQKKIIDDKKVMGKISSDGIYTKHNLQWKNQDNVVLSNEEITEYLWKGLE
jgi:putative ABC transport system ATP-binding protein